MNKSVLREEDQDCCSSLRRTATTKKPQYSERKVSKAARIKILQIIGISMRCICQHAMFYLAAAVSDYYVPWKDMV
ncbi:phosphopantothenate-cysteine ligase 1-like protein [Trifolium pratense]|uniref:Phosphopantothenate-cysteine ligase 1-like protein n=1 Tax=Trifolium pratense TaxID=57577 RepID=A0A2K3NGJ1_TRIPR|nr:phosphopantothenate-cysteine ligase 1-like protein [Trifolium pratense]